MKPADIEIVQISIGGWLRWHAITPLDVFGPDALICQVKPVHGWPRHAFMSRGESDCVVLGLANDSKRRGLLTQSAKLKRSLNSYRPNNAMTALPARIKSAGDRKRSAHKWLESPEGKEAALRERLAKLEAAAK